MSLPRPDLANVSAQHKMCSAADISKKIRPILHRDDIPGLIRAS